MKSTFFELFEELRRTHIPVGHAGTGGNLPRGVTFQEVCNVRFQARGYLASGQATEKEQFALWLMGFSVPSTEVEARIVAETLTPIEIEEPGEWLKRVP